MTLSIAQQVEANRNLLLNLPTVANFSHVWQPETLSYKLSVVYETTDRGWASDNADVAGDLIVIN